MALTLPYPDMNFVPLDVLTAAEQNQLVANIEFIANNVENTSGVYASARTRVYVDGTNGDDSNSGLDTSSPKKTLASVMDKVNELGGSIDIRFMSAGTYDLVGGYVNGVNILFEKNSSGIGDVEIRVITRQSFLENSFFTFNAMKFTSTYQCRAQNSYLLFQSNSVIDADLRADASVVYVDSSIVKGKIQGYYGAAINLATCTVEPKSTSTSGSQFTITSSSQGLFNNITLNSPDASGTLTLMNIASASYVAITGTLTDATGAIKYYRAVTCADAIVSCTTALMSSYEATAVNASTWYRALQIVGNATVGA